MYLQATVANTNISEFLLIFIGVYLLYNIVLASIIQQSISAMHIHISPLFGFPSICSPQHNEFPVLYNWFSLVILCVCVRAHTHKHMHTRTQSCRLCNLIVCSLPGSSVHGNSQASILEWVAICFSRESSQPGIKSVSPVSPALAGRFFNTSTTWEVFIHELCLAAQYCPTLIDYSPPGSSVHGDFPGKNIGLGCHALLQGIFPIQGSNPGLPHGRQILYHLSQQGSPRILQWVAYPLSRGNFDPGIEPGSPALEADSLPAELPRKPPFIHSSVYICQIPSPNSHSILPFPLVSTHLFSMSVSLFLLCQQAHLYNFSRFHT